MRGPNCFFFRVSGPALICIWFAFGGSAWAAAEEDAQASGYAAPRWVFALKGGEFKPDLKDYETFYGSDGATYWAVEGAYRFNNWLSLGAELGYSKDKGVGLLPGSGNLGGEVEYTLVPAQLFINLRYEASPRQWVVPYAGVGLAMAWYKQKIDQQPDNEGRADVGGAARVGLELLLNGFDKRGADYVRDGRRLNSYFFVEAQVYSSELDSIDLGGELYLLGLRFAFD